MESKTSSSTTVVVCPIVDGTQSCCSNSNNHMDYAPFLGERVDKTWFNGLAAYQQADISKAAPDLTLVDEIAVPHDASISCTASGAAIYSAFLHTYDYHKWFEALSGHLPKDTHIHILSKCDRRALAQMSTIRILSHRCVTQTGAFEDLSSDFVTAMQIRLKQLNNMAFVKLSTSSGKNDRPLRPVSSVPELLNYLCESKTVQADLSDDTTTCAIVTMPWNKSVDPKREYRVFVYKARITAVSQQSLYQDVGLDAEIVSRTAQTIHQWFDTHLRASMPFANAVLDVWMDSDNTAHLIEANPWGVWASSGIFVYISSLLFLFEFFFSKIVKHRIQSISLGARLCQAAQ
jgi:hypothetical protein